MEVSGFNSSFLHENNIHALTQTKEFDNFRNLNNTDSDVDIIQVLSKCFSLFNSAQVRKLHFLLFTGTGSRFFSFRLRERGLFLGELGCDSVVFPRSFF